MNIASLKAGVRQVATMCVLMHCSFIAYAGSEKHSNDFQILYDHLTDWASGTLGKSIALVFLLVGLGIGAIRGSILGAVTCLAAGLSLVIAPSVIDTLFKPVG